MFRRIGVELLKLAQLPMGVLATILVESLARCRLCTQLTDIRLGRDVARAVKQFASGIGDPLTENERHSLYLQCCKENSEWIWEGIGLKAFPETNVEGARGSNGSCTAASCLRRRQLI
jgi:hypothetical protein